MSDLKPCPFCGSGEVSVVHGKFMWWVACDKCEALGACNGKKEKAIEAWNRRAHE